MGWVRVARVQGKKAYNSGKGAGRASGRREVTELEEKLGPWLLGGAIALFVILWVIAFIFS